MGSPSPLLPRLELHELDVRTGLWCRVCALPSAVEVDLALVLSASLRIVGRATARGCADCGARSMTHHR